MVADSPVSHWSRIWSWVFDCDTNKYIIRLGEQWFLLITHLHLSHLVLNRVNRIAQMIYQVVDTPLPLLHSMRSRFLGYAGIFYAHIWFYTSHIDIVSLLPLHTESALH